MTPLHIFMIGRRGDRNCQRLAGDGKRPDGAVDRNSLDARPADAVWCRPQFFAQPIRRGGRVHRPKRRSATSERRRAGSGIRHDANVSVYRDPQASLRATPNLKTRVRCADLGGEEFQRSSNCVRSRRRLVHHWCERLTIPPATRIAFAAP